MPPIWLAWLLPLLAIGGLLVGWGETKARLRSASELATKTADELAKATAEAKAAIAEQRAELMASIMALRAELTAELGKSRGDQGRRVGVVEERLAYLTGALEGVPPQAPEGGRRRTMSRAHGVPVPGVDE